MLISARFYEAIRELMRANDRQCEVITISKFVDKKINSVLISD